VHGGIAFARQPSSEASPVYEEEGEGCRADVAKERVYSWGGPGIGLGSLIVVGRRRMDAFESLVSSILDRDGFWTRTEYKVELTKDEKREIGRRPARARGRCRAGRRWPAA